jgi:DNA-binding transcriptional ArsR family regulator
MVTTPTAHTPALRRQADVLARFFKGLADPTRVLILRLLLDGEKNVTELVELVGSPQGRVSSHLGCLRHCALLRIPQDLVAEHARELLSCTVLADEEQADTPAALQRS